MRKVLFIDRDGTLIEEPEDFQVDALSKVKFLPGVFTYLGKIAKELDFDLVMVTNQDGLGTESFPMDDFEPAQRFIVDSLEREGIRFSNIHIDGSLPHENKPTRKPGIGMLGEYFSDGYDLKSSFVIGDRETDVQLAANLGCKSIFIETGRFQTPDNEGLKSVRDWREIYEHLRFPSRTAIRNRKTSETEISVEVNLDGRGESQISTGIHFFDHMLEQISRHGGIDLKIVATGDLHVDEHHTIEDVAIALGETFSDALGDKRGIERYGFCLPMDDCLAQVAIDFGGRNWCVWEAEFKRESIGQMPTEMFFHFFKSFSDKAQCNLNIKAEGTIEHHKIEAIFKAFAKAIKMAVRRDAGNASVPSTKGVI